MKIRLTRQAAVPRVTFPAQDYDLPESIALYLIDNYDAIDLTNADVPKKPPKPKKEKAVKPPEETPEDSA